jgi:hypothetical protein
MKAIAVFLLFIGMFLVVQGYYQQQTKCQEPTVQIKYVPQSVYEEQLGAKNNGSAISKQFKGMFEDINPWSARQG